MASDPSDIDNLSNAELLELRKSASKVHPEAGVVRLTPGTVAKPSQDMDEDATDPSEANPLDLVFSQTTIPVPRVRRVINCEWCFLIVMDYIDGPTLAQVWPTLYPPTGTPPGPLAAQGPARICESPVFGQVQSRRGPFTSYAELSAFFHNRHRRVLDVRSVPQDDPARKDLFDDSEPLVLTHQDINLRNIVYVATQRQSEDARISGTDDEFWKALIPFICGPYFRQRGYRGCTRCTDS
ncbi:hypothetical protein OH76DRAFT_1457641 [Lentinus brumalis]|uniref:Aminoglycoside phosphotransferase domain-containing protein n=1 Tax=Lentinus brumalis TaxID=2498619 RepID=A0A371CYX3_9APHY|nr:hypothetical protein OH76DRAFT_1457641 [Polyporus brumalis]